MQKKRIGIFSGGPSKEHEVSVMTASQIVKHIDRNLYDVVEVFISPKADWSVEKNKLPQMIDFAFIAMHGAYGEDGVIQAILEDLHIPYSGSGVMASSLAMDKYRSNLIAQQVGLLSPQTWLIGLSVFTADQLPEQLIVKPNNSGSSDGLKIINRSEIVTDINKFIEQNLGLLMQEYISGRELTVPVLGQEALPVIEIISKNKLYDYQAKYQSGQSEHVIPAKINSSAAKLVAEQALLIHRSLGCEVVSRSDFILTDDSIYYLETNTIPGMTPTSLLPESAAKSGVNFTQLITKMIDLSLLK